MSDLDVDKGSALLIILWALTSGAGLFVVCRLLVRLRILRRAGWDDFLITVSILLGYVYAAVVTIAVHHGYGKHMTVLDPQQMSQAIMYIVAGFCPGLLSIVVPKLAVVALLVRTMNPSARQKCILWGIAMGSGLLLMGCVLILYVQCQPSQSLWYPWIPGSRCWSMAILVNYSIAVGAIAAAVDAYLAIYPAVIIWRLHMSIKKKLALSLALGLGACACVMAVVKCTQLPTLYITRDLTYGTVDLFIWTSIESNTIIIAACVPTIAPLLEITLGKRVLGTTEKDTDSAGRPHGHGQEQAQLPMHHHNRARAWLSAINIEQSYHQCSIQRAGSSHGSMENLNPSEEGIQRRDDVIIEYGQWPEWEIGKAY